MMPSVKIAAGAVVFLAGTAGTAFAQSTPLEFTTAKGKTLILPPIAEMECDEIEVLLGRIDSTRYRENAPTPHNKADTPLFEYELTLAEENYHRCVVPNKVSDGGLRLLRRIPGN